MLNFPKDHLLQIEVTCGRLLYELKTIWDEIGKSESERDIKLIEIQQECLVIYQTKIEEAKKYREDLERQIAFSEAEIKAICSSLDDPNFHFKALSSSSMSLREQMEAVYPQLEEMKRKRDERKGQFIEILEKINSILRELKPNNTPYMDMDEFDLSTRRFLELKSQLENLKKEKADRRRQVRELLDSLTSLSLVLGIDHNQIIQGEFRSSVTETNISDGVIQRLVYETERLRGIKRNRMEKLQDMVTSMLELWTLMDTPVEEQQCFQKVASNIAACENEITEPNSLSLDFLNNVEYEVMRLETLKVSKMRDLVLKKKYELEHISTRAHLNEGNNTEMDSMLGALENGGVDPSKILEGLESKISNAKEEAFSRKEILERVDKFLAAREEETWLDEYNRDDNRYSVAKGAHLVLKRAEKARTLVSKIPGMVETLIMKTRAWENERGAEFKYDGKGLVAMLEDYTKQRQEKEQEKKRRREQRKLKTEPQEAQNGSKGSLKGLKKNVISRTLSGRHERKPSITGTPRSARKAEDTTSTPFSARRSELGPGAPKRRQLDPWSEHGSRPSTPSNSDFVNGFTPSKSDFVHGSTPSKSDFGNGGDDDDDDDDTELLTPRSVSSAAYF